MKKIALALVAAAALAGAGMAISSGGPNEKLASQTRLYGGGVYGPCFDGTTFCFGNGARTFAVDVHVDGDGSGAAYGDWQNGVAGSFMFKGQITCARVLGDMMIIGGYLTQATSDPTFVGLAFAQYLRDNGSIESGTPDEMTFSEFGPADGQPGDFPTSFPEKCPSQPFSDDIFPRLWSPLDGDIVVQK